jgi:hypothetical protein
MALRIAGSDHVSPISPDYLSNIHLLLKVFCQFSDILILPEVLLTLHLSVLCTFQALPDILNIISDR